MATTAAMHTFRRVYANPGDPAAAEEQASRLSAYALLWSYYTSSAFEDLRAWEPYRAKYGLYRHIRPIYNPTRRLVDFYAGITYQGHWQDDPAAMVEIGAAIPWATATPPALLGAIAQIYQWSNWRSRKSLITRYAAATGDALGIVVDDMQRRKVYLDAIWPGHVASVTTNAAGDVTAYALEYEITDDAGKTYTYRREVDKDAIRTYRDGEPHGYEEQPAAQANPYGFVPAVWINHTPTGTTHGDPAIRAIGKIDEANNLAAHALDQAHRILESPILIAGDNISDGTRPTKAGATSSQTQPRGSREEMKIITGAQGADIKTARLDPGETLEHLDRLLKEIEADHPELSMYQQLRQMTQVSGPAADRLFGDVRTLVEEARAQYDQQTIKLFQMATAIAGWRLSSGAWPEPTRQQLKFSGYTLDSYDAGDLDLAIQTRPLILPTREEVLRLEQMESGIAADRQYAAAGETPQSRIADRIRQAAQGQQAPTQQPAQAPS